jgi:hypothetical protein
MRGTIDQYWPLPLRSVALSLLPKGEKNGDV